MSNLIAPKKGEMWTIEGRSDLTFVGQGRDSEMTKQFIFHDPVDGFFVISKDDFYAADLFKEKQSNE